MTRRGRNANGAFLGAGHGQHYSANHRDCRVASLRWRLVRPGTLVLVRGQRDHREDGRADRCHRPDMLKATGCHAGAPFLLSAFQFRGAQRIASVNP